jgi:ABC-type nitrate/sulfonate/bicarbonate transport system permease component
LIEILVSFALVVSLGTSLGFAFAERELLGQVFEPMTTAFYSIPNVLLYPATFIIFGLGESSKIVFGFILGFFPVAANVLAGLRQMDRNYVVLALSMGAKRRTVYGKVIIPAAAPAIVSGLKQGLTLTTIGVMGAELLASYGGVGYMSAAAKTLFATPELFGVTLVGSGIAIAGNLLLTAAEKTMRT